MTLPPLPECYSRFKHEDGMPLYSADQMREYAAAAAMARQEACAKLIESIELMGLVGDQLAELIRAMKD